MPNDDELQRFQSLQKKVERLKTDKSKAEGALEQLKKQLADDFDCDSVEEAEKLIDELEAKQKADEERFQKDLHEFEKTYGDQLEAIS